MTLPKNNDSGAPSNVGGNVSGPAVTFTLDTMLSDHLHPSQTSSQCHGSLCWPLPANTRLIWTLQLPHMSSSLHNNNLGQLLVAKRYIGGRLHDMFQGLGWFCVCKISETMATACAAAADYPCSRSPSVQHWLLVTTAAAAAVQMHDHFLVLHSRAN